MATIDSSGQNLSDEQNLLNEVHLVIAFIGNPTWIKERKEGTSFFGGGRYNLGECIYAGIYVYLQESCSIM